MLVKNRFYRYDATIGRIIAMTSSTTSTIVIILLFFLL